MGGGGWSVNACLVSFPSKLWNSDKVQGHLDLSGHLDIEQVPFVRGTGGDGGEVLLSDVLLEYFQYFLDIFSFPQLWLNYVILLSSTVDMSLMFYFHYVDFELYFSHKVWTFNKSIMLWIWLHHFGLIKSTHSIQQWTQLYSISRLCLCNIFKMFHLLPPFFT